MRTDNFLTEFPTLVVPSFLKTGITTPILKKTTLDPNIPNNYIPITLGLTHRNFFEFLMPPHDTAHSNQFGYQEDRGTSLACASLNKERAGEHLWPVQVWILRGQGNFYGLCKFGYGEGRGTYMACASLNTERAGEHIWPVQVWIWRGQGNIYSLCKFGFEEGRGTYIACASLDTERAGEHIWPVQVWIWRGQGNIYGLHIC